MVAINHSPLTSIVFNRALNLAQQEQAKLTLLHWLADLTAIDPGFQSGGTFGFYPINTGLSQSLREETLQLQIEQAKTWLQEYCDRATVLNISTEYQHHFGEPGATISSAAQEWNADPIVLSRHDHSAIAEFFVGSVSNHVVDRANCSVVVIKDTNPDRDK
ncbi:universal stress protein [Tychonema sp. LEGE 07199]|nr:universal stress protein [Tychonema sp. LEGE 07199]MBE9122502.1 universal stress protein [Tychonema sp. LEGE 07199]MBE9133597.1 universal stress protein [Tychonema sp. LEGE 07196]